MVNKGYTLYWIHTSRRFREAAHAKTIADSSSMLVAAVYPIRLPRLFIFNQNPIDTHAILMELIDAAQFVLVQIGNVQVPDPPAWMRDGPFQVFRRLAQDVPGFYAQIAEHVHSLPSDDPVTEDLLAAELVGCWRSGTPLEIAPERDERTFRAKYVVSSAGTIESAKIALLSGLADPNGKIGVGMTDHPIFFTHFAIPAISPFFETMANSRVLSQHRTSSEHPYNRVLELGADFNQGRYVDDDILARHQREQGNTMLELVFLFNAPLMDENRLEQFGPSFAQPGGKPVLRRDQRPQQPDHTDARRHPISGRGSQPEARRTRWCRP